jgi:hypothetical protein
MYAQHAISTGDAGTQLAAQQVLLSHMQLAAQCGTPLLMDDLNAHIGILADSHTDDSAACHLSCMPIQLSLLPQQSAAPRPRAPPHGAASWQASTCAAAGWTILTGRVTQDAPAQPSQVRKGSTRPYHVLAGLAALPLLAGHALLQAAGCSLPSQAILTGPCARCCKHQDTATMFLRGYGRTAALRHT